MENMEERLNSEILEGIIGDLGELLDDSRDINESMRVVVEKSYQELLKITHKKTTIIPETCENCRHIGDYTCAPYKRDPHYCCELIWQLFEQDYRVDPKILDEKCPFRHEKFKEAYIEIHDKF